MIAVGKVTGREVKTNMDGASDKLMLQVEITDPDDIQTVQLMSQTGEQYNPPNDSQVLILSVSDTFRVAIAADDGIVPTMDPGDRKVYSVSAGAVSAFLNLLSGGTIEVNGNADWAVAYTDLKTAFDQLVSDFDGHLHSGVTAGGVSSGPPTASSTADMTNAKVESVKLP